MNVVAHILTFNEEEILPYTLKNYGLFCSKIILHDAFSTDRTREIARQAGAEVRDWDTGGKLNDMLAMQLKDTCWLGTDADWVLVADADELLYFPMGAAFTLSAYAHVGYPVIKPHGFSMFSEVFPTTPGQIYEEVKMGVRDLWYAKPILFAPARLRSINFDPGAHGCSVVLKDGTVVKFPVEVGTPSLPPTYLLHYRHLGSLERIARRNDLKRARLADINLACGWGYTTPGMQQALEQQEYFKLHLEQILP
jgi:glycosyltransferase involved in cell wall biosynthesis